MKNILGAFARNMVFANIVLSDTLPLSSKERGRLKIPAGPLEQTGAYKKCDDRHM